MENREKIIFFSREDHGGCSWVVLCMPVNVGITNQISWVVKTEEGGKKAEKMKKNKNYKKKTGG